jgi:integrase/recombinase XerD
VQGVSSKTINRNLSSLRHLCQWALREGLLTGDPTAGIQALPEEQLSPRSLSDEAVDALLRLRAQALLALLVYARLRT